MKEILMKFDEIVYAGVSIGGGGVYAIVRTDNTDISLHPFVVDALGEMFKGFGLVFDKGCKDVSRLRFLSYDETAYFNENAIEFQTGHITNIAPVVQKRHIDFTTQNDNDRTKALVEKYVSVIQSQNIDITANYEDWLRCAFSLASHFGYDGSDYFHVISQNNAGYDFAKCEKKYEHAVKAGRRSGIGSFIKLCKSHNITI
jgi:hypothetical protein